MTARCATAWLLAALACLAATAASAQQRVEGLSATQLFAAADQLGAERRSADALAIYDVLANDPNADIRAEARFRRGMLLASLKRYTEAATSFRALLDEKPGATRVRIELARVLAAIGDEAAARRELRQAQAGQLPPEVALAVSQFARALRSPKRVGGSIEASIAPDSNINRATSARTLDTVIAPVTLSRDARARSGLGVRLAGQGYARIGLTDRLSLLPRVAGLGTLYRTSEANDISASALVGLEWQRGRDRWSPAIGETWRWYGRRPYARSDTAAVDWLHPLSNRAQLVVHGGAAHVDYRRNDLQDGGLFDVSLGVERALSPRAGISAAVSGYRQTARDPGYATVSAGLSLLSWRDWGRTTLFASAGLSRLEGDQRLSLFSDRRREWLLQASAGATLRRFTVHGFAPVVRLRLERNWSSVGLYDYQRVATDFGLTRAF